MLFVFLQNAEFTFSGRFDLHYPPQFPFTSSWLQFRIPNETSIGIPCQTALMPQGNLSDFYEYLALLSANVWRRRKLFPRAGASAIQNVNPVDKRAASYLTQ